MIVVQNQYTLTVTRCDGIDKFGQDPLQIDLGRDAQALGKVGEFGQRPEGLRQAGDEIRAEEDRRIIAGIQ